MHNFLLFAQAFPRPGQLVVIGVDFLLAIPPLPAALASNHDLGCSTGRCVGCAPHASFDRLDLGKESDVPKMIF